MDSVTSAIEEISFESLQHGPSFATVANRAFLRITGTDTTRWLNGMVTNSVQALQPGQGNYNFLLNAQGRIQGDCNIYREHGDSTSFLLATSTYQIETIQQLLDKFIIMDDVELARAYKGGESLFLVGSEASTILPQLGLPVTEPDHLISASTQFGDVHLLTGYASSIPQWEIRSEASVIATLKEKAVDLGAKSLAPEDLEAIRILSGRPRYSVDIRDRDLPQETNQTHALHFAKGCYLGQEIVERIRSRGQVHRLFTAFQLVGSIPELPSPLEANGKAAGELTSAARVGSKVYALGYARREALDLKQELTYPGGTATPRTIPNSKSIQQDEKNHG